MTWLRVKLIADRAGEVGLTSVADQIEGDWKCVADMLGIREDYYGCYDKTFLPDLRATIDDMLTEASPRFATEEEINYSGPINNSLSPPAVLNQAWRQLQQYQSNYARWESEAVSSWID